MEKSKTPKIPNVDYALVPDYHFPVPLIQMNRAISFIDEHKDEYHINMDKNISVYPRGSFEQLIDFADKLL